LESVRKTFVSVTYSLQEKEHKVSERKREGKEEKEGRKSKGKREGSCHGKN